MATATKSKGANVPATTKAKEVAVVDEALPDFLQGYEGETGAEDIGSTDVAIPRLKLAQGMSQEVKDGLMKEGDLFLNVTGDILAHKGEPLRFVPIMHQKEYILWRDRKDNGGGIMARANPAKTDDGEFIRDPEGNIRYAWDKPNQIFETKLDGKHAVKWTTKRFIDEDGLGEWGSEVAGDKESGIAATAHYNYVVMLPDHGNMVCALSLARTQTKRAKDFNTMIKMSKVPMFGRVFILTAEDDKAGANTFANYRFRPGGVVQDKATFDFAQEIRDALHRKGFTVDQSDGGDDSVGGKEKGDGKF